MALIRTLLFCVLLTVGILAQKKYEYSECVYNVYKAACLGNHITIRRLDCVNCNLRQFPVLKNQENCVLLRGNLIEAFPDDFEKIKQVKTLDLAENRLQALPENLDLLTDLQILDVSRNRLSTLSPRTRFPVALRGLLLAGNQMTTIPGGVRVPGLFVLDLSGNQFTEIPVNFCMSDQLIRVDFTGNPLESDVSSDVDVLNRCRNANDIPFCVYTDFEEYSCKCDTLAPILLAQPSFCMGTSTRNHAITCSAGSSAMPYGSSALVDINRRLDVVRENCSYALRASDATAVMKTGFTLTVALSLFSSLNVPQSHGFEG